MTDTDVRTFKRACEQCDEHAAMELLAAGLSPDLRDQEVPLICMAAVCSCAPIVRLLADAGADLSAHDRSGRTALHHAVGHLEVADVLLRAGSPVDVVDNLEWTPLSIAASIGELTVVRMLLEAGADPNLLAARGRSALMIAASAGQTEPLRLLVDLGADVNAESEAGDTALSLTEAALARHRGPNTAALEEIASILRLGGDTRRES